MKSYKLSLSFLLIVVFFSLASAQNETYPWQFFFGINAVDTFPTGASGAGDLFEEFLNFNHWNVAPYPSFIGVKNHLGAGFSFGTRFSFNKIKHYGKLTADDKYYNFDGMLTFNLGKLFKSERFKPFLEIGGGYYVIFDKTGAGYFNLGTGIEYWLGEKKENRLNFRVRI